MPALKWFFISLVLVVSLFPSNVYAQKADKLDDKNYNDEIHAQRVGSNLLKEGLYALGGVCLTANQQCYGETFTGKADGSLEITPIAYSGGYNDSAIGQMTGVMTAMYLHQPTSSVEYLANIGENLGIAPKPAMAQLAGVGVGGSGDGVIKPVLALWKVSRNLAYAGFIIIFIVAGLMIMFGRKADSHAHDSITIQQALPGMVLGLILVTFSYFIASLLVDIAFVGVRLMAEFFVRSGLANIYDPIKAAKESNLFQLHWIAGWDNFLTSAGAVDSSVWSTLNSNGFGVKNLMPAIISTLLQGLMGTLLPVPGAGATAATIVGGAAGAAVNFVAGAVVTTLASLIIPLILLIVLMIQFFRLLFSLLSAYIQILVYTVLGPFFIMWSAIPGRGGVLSGWLKTIAANSLIFPAVFGMFMLAGVILKYPTSEWGHTTLPLFGGLSTEIVRLLLAYGILLGIPAIPDMIKQAMGVRNPAAGIGQAALGGFMGVTGLAQRGLEKTYVQPIQHERSAYREASLRDRFNPRSGRLSAPWWVRRFNAKP